MINWIDANLSSPNNSYDCLLIVQDLNMGPEYHCGSYSDRWYFSSGEPIKEPYKVTYYVPIETLCTKQDETE